MTLISPDMTFKPIDGLEVTHVPDGAMIYHNERERVHFLNQTAFIVFELCDMQKSVAEIEGFVAEAFGLAESPAEAVRQCLVSLLDEGLVVCAPSSAGH